MVFFRIGVKVSYTGYSKDMLYAAPLHMLSRRPALALLALENVELSALLFKPRVDGRSASTPGVPESPCTKVCHVVLLFSGLLEDTLDWRLCIRVWYRDPLRLARRSINPGREHADVYRFPDLAQLLVN